MAPKQKPFSGHMKSRAGGQCIFKAVTGSSEQRLRSTNNPLPRAPPRDAQDSGRVLTIPPAGRRKHIAVFGKSGVGKTTSLI